MHLRHQRIRQASKVTQRGKTISRQRMALLFFIFLQIFGNSIAAKKPNIIFMWVFQSFGQNALVVKIYLIQANSSLLKIIASNFDQWHNFSFNLISSAWRTTKAQLMWVTSILQVSFLLLFTNKTMVSKFNPIFIQNFHFFGCALYGSKWVYIVVCRSYPDSQSW